MADTCDVIMIGGGPVGENAWHARDNGLSVALVERELVGGECDVEATLASESLGRREGLADIAFWDSRDATTAKEVRGRLAGRVHRPPRRRGRADRGAGPRGRHYRQVLSVPFGSVAGTALPGRDIDGVARRAGVPTLNEVWRRLLESDRGL